ncbi:MAG: phosphatidate cytidylyltransferase [Bacillota bacterium]
MICALLRERLLSSLVFAPLVGLAFYYGGSWFAATLSIAALIAAREYRRLMVNLGIDVGLVYVIVSVVVVMAGLLSDGVFFVPVLATGSLILLGAALFQSDAVVALYGLAGYMYIGGLFGAIALLRTGPNGRSWALLALFVTWATDVGAYVGGSALGKRKLFPKVSPSKSVEGAVCGVICAAVVSGALAELLGFPFTFAVIAGLFLSMLAEMGDLVESLLKRFCKAKDSGALIPGHGGILDRFDSLLFTGAGTLLLRIIYQTVSIL